MIVMELGFLHEKTNRSEVNNAVEEQNKINLNKKN